jgi:hypothetical protein
VVWISQLGSVQYTHYIGAVPAELRGFSNGCIAHLTQHDCLSNPPACVGVQAGLAAMTHDKGNPPHNRLGLQSSHASAAHGWTGMTRDKL